MNRLFLLLVTSILLILVSCKKDTVTLETLLKEMTDRTVITRFPENQYTLKQFSSYDRKSVSPDEEGWWANADCTQFIGEENNNGRREFVMFDTDGPGAVVRFWMTFAGEGATDGTLRIYLDGNKEPVIEGNVLDILSGNKLAPEPLASSVSPETEYLHRGHNLYFPIPYANHAKITYECDAVTINGNSRKPSIYYNIDYRTYKPKIQVESFSQQVLERAGKQLENTAKRLLNPANDFQQEINESKLIQSGEKYSFEIKNKRKAISRIRVKVNAEDINQALRSTVLAISFDGNETVWVPLGDFFGTGYQLNSSKTWYSKVNANGIMEANWIMPFKGQALIKLINYGEQPVDINLQLETQDYRWTKSTMYFGASWHEYNHLYTSKNDSLKDHKWHFDVNYVDLNGKGIYVGDALTVFNTVNAWWGEGDEKIFVDGEKFPSCIGTGTEDYYGYAWCRPEKFSHPFIAQPTGGGNFHPGMTVNMRYRSLDAIPFTQQLSSNIEMWHWVKTKINYAMTAYWYIKPGTTSNILPDTANVKKQVALKRIDIYPPLVGEDGKIEGEYLEVLSCDSGIAESQSGFPVWNNESQLWWRNAKKGDQLLAKFILTETGKYRISAQLTKAVDYGIIRLFINGTPAGRSFNGYSKDGVTTSVVDLGTRILSKGDNILSMKIVGADKNAKPGNMAGIDYLLLEKI